MAKAVVTPFEVQVAPEHIADLRDRLARARWPDWLPGADWSYGVDEAYLKRLCAYWQDGYDFDGYVARLNAWPQYIGELDGERIQFYHVRSKVPTARPLVLVHGWPGSVVEFLDLIGPLSDPEAHGGRAEDAFHVVVPSLPGYGYSGPTRGQGVNIAAAGALIDGVMAALGYDRYFAQGGDWGAITTSRMAETYPDRVAALHVNMAPGGPSNPFQPVEGLTEAEEAELQALRQFLMGDSAYAQIQSTRPQTLGVAMNDSPAGLAGWIIDKFYAWTDHGGDLDSAFDMDHLLDNLTLYWLTGTAASSFRLYHENNFRTAYRHAEVGVPTGVARWAGEPFRWPRSLAEKTYTNVQDWREFDGGGHFAAFQRKDEFLGAVRGFFRTQKL
jgi:pimeloyl-ACP methyl ester carboxylesterase